jgi:hypothetical protein
MTRDRLTEPGTTARLHQLLREAFDLLNDPESRVDLRDWNKEVRKVIAATMEPATT